MAESKKLIEAAYLKMHADQMRYVPGPTARRIANELREQASDIERAVFATRAALEPRDEGVK